MKKNGFTLVEVLVVISILSVVGVIILTIFTRVLKANNKAQILAGIKQNGQAVLENMDKTIRNSGKLLCPTALPSNTLLVEKDGLYTRYRIALAGDNTVPSSCLINGCIVSDNPVKTNALESDTDFIKETCQSANLMTSANILTDTNSQTGVAITSGSISPNTSAGFKEVVTINFKLGPGTGASPSVAGQIDPVNFVTTVQLR